MSAYEFSVVPWADLHVRRRIRIAGTSTLADLHGAILRGFEFDDDHAHAFFLNAHFWDDEFGFWSLPDRGQRATADATLDMLGLRVHKRFAYLFDYGDEHRFDVRVLRIADSEQGPEQGVVVESVGDAPPQYPESDDRHLDQGAAGCEDHVSAPELSDLARRVEPVVLAWERTERDADGDGPADDTTQDHESELATERESAEPPDEAGSDELLDDDPAKLREEYALANEVLDRTHDSAAAIHVDLEHAISADVMGWLSTLPERLVDAELAEPAAQLTERLLAMQTPELAFLRQVLPRYLAMAGRDEEARAQIERNLVEEPEDPAALYEAGLTWIELTELARAEQSLREALRFAGTERSLREAIVDELAELLEATGGDVQRLLADEDAWVEARQAKLLGSISPSRQPVVREGAKVGRNDPCPCGSGKKYKKCHGAR